MPKNRHERSEAALAPKKGKLKQLERILIVCEGEKTEPLYFDAIRKEKRVPKAEVHITQGDGTDPLSVVNFAEAYFREHRGFDVVFAVFDRDDHATYHAALARAQTLTKTLKNDNGTKVPFYAIPSVPNFELWLLLHFRDVTDFMPRADVMASLRSAAYYPAYEKGHVTTFAETKDRLPDAVRRSVWLRERYTAQPGTEPYTDADFLTLKLWAMEERFKR
jgi:hypothetical protein